MRRLVSASALPLALAHVVGRDSVLFTMLLGMVGLLRRRRD